MSASVTALADGYLGQPVKVVFHLESGAAVARSMHDGQPCLVGRSSSDAPWQLIATGEYVATYSTDAIVCAVVQKGETDKLCVTRITADALVRVQAACSLLSPHFTQVDNVIDVESFTDFISVTLSRPGLRNVGLAVFPVVSGMPQPPLHVLPVDFPANAWCIGCGTGGGSSGSLQLITCVLPDATVLQFVPTAQGQFVRHHGTLR